MRDRSRQIRIRDAVSTEFDLISALMVRANDQYSDMATNPAWRSYLEDAADVAGHAVTLTVIVAERSGSLVGSVGYSAPHAPPEGKQSLPAAWAVIRSLAVDPSARGRGIGRALALECLARAQRDGAATVGLTTHERMSVAKSIYEHMGFVRAPSYDYFPDPDVHVIAYRLDLSATVGDDDDVDDSPMSVQRMAGSRATAVDGLLERIARTTVVAWGQYASRVGGRVVVDGGLTFVVGTNPTPIIINTVFRTDPSVSPTELFARSRAFYDAIGHGFTLLTSDHADADLEDAAEASGWSMAIKVPAMVCRSAVPDRPLPAGAAIRRADPLVDIDAFRVVVREGFASDDDEIAAADAVFSSPAALAMPDTVAVIASIDGRDAAAAMVNVIDGMGYVAWVGTLPAYRRRGLGELVSRAATNAAFELGADIVALEASSMGLALYARIGYETVGVDRIWLPPSGARGRRS